MYSLKNLLLVLLICLPNLLFSFGHSDDSLVKKVNLIQLEDKDFRTLGVMPLFNQTGNDTYAYLGKTIQRFLTENLLILKQVRVNTNDFEIPENYRSNPTNVFSYGTNFTRNIIVLKANDVYKKFLADTKADNIKSFAENSHCDYLVNGTYTFNNKSTEQFKVQYNIYNRIRKQKVYENKLIFNPRNMEDDVRKMSDDILKFFKVKLTGTMKIITAYSNPELFIDSVLVDNTLRKYELPSGPHNLQVKLLNHVFNTNFYVKTDTQTVLYFTNKIRNTGIVKVKSEPAAADVFLNVQHLGRTPLSASNIVTGKYRMQVSRSNYQTYFQDVNIGIKTNSYFVELERILTPRELQEKNERNKTIMYIGLGAGTVCMLSAYLFYAESGLDEDRYNLYHEKKYIDKYNRDLTISFISLLGGITSYTVSFIYFLKVLNYDDVNIGFIQKKRSDLFYVRNERNNYFLWQAKF